ncbi:MAG: GGDEF domain-containing protein, partial [Burkholderiaceae bacterium]|nr:GGDEF domain-containing protein [Burkholderiaceae bacterium]
MTIRAFPRSLIARLVGISLLLLLVVQAAGFAVVRASIDRNARSQIARELDTDERVWHRLLEQNADRLRQGSGLLAADFGFRSAVNSGDQGTIQSALENHGARIGAVVTALLDTQFALRAASLAESMPPQPDSLLPVIQSLAVQPQASQVAVLGGQAYMFVMVPLKAPVVIGWVLMGFPIGQPLAEEMRQLLAVDVAVLVQPQGAAMSLPVSTLTGAALAQLRDSAGAVGELETDAGTLLVRSISLDALGGQV